MRGRASKTVSTASERAQTWRLRLESRRASPSGASHTTAAVHGSPGTQASPFPSSKVGSRFAHTRICHLCHFLYQPVACGQTAGALCLTEANTHREMRTHTPQPQPIAHCLQGGLWKFYKVSSRGDGRVHPNDATEITGRRAGRWEAKRGSAARGLPAEPHFHAVPRLPLEHPHRAGSPPSLVVRNLTCLTP